MSLVARSTPYLIESPQGLRQIIHIRPPKGWQERPASVTVTGAGFRETRPVQPEQISGDIVEIAVPPAETTTAYEITFEQEGREALTATVELKPARRWEVYVVHHSHLDVGYTDPQPKVIQNHLSFLDQVLALCRATDEWPDDARFRWQIEVTWPLKLWMASRSQRDIQEMVQRIREGRVEVAGAYLNMHTEAYDLDQLMETFRFVNHIARKTTNWNQIATHVFGVKWSSPVLSEGTSTQAVKQTPVPA